jgi:hypothetical protein
MPAFNSRVSRVAEPAMLIVADSTASGRVEHLREMHV